MGDGKEEERLHRGGSKQYVQCHLLMVMIGRCCRGIRWRCHKVRGEGEEGGRGRDGRGAAEDG